MTQYAVVWRPDLTHEARALGPYRTFEKANEVLEDMVALEEQLDLVAGFDDDPMSWLPQVVVLEGWQAVKRELVDRYSVDTNQTEGEPHA